MSAGTSSDVQRKRRRPDEEAEDGRTPRNSYGDATVDGQARVWQGNSHDTHYHFHGRPSASEKSKSADVSLKELVQSLKFKNIDSRLHNIKPALAKTCQWLFQHGTFLAWNDDAQLEEHRGFLYIRGNPGTGKSTIMKIALQWAKKLSAKNKSATVSYFFNARATADLEKSPLGLYRSLTHQLLQAIPSLQPSFHEMFAWKDCSDTIDWTIPELQGFLIEAVQNEARPALCMFIDALDEGDDKDVKALVSFLEDLTGHAAGYPTLKICLSSRHYPHITMRRGLSLIVETQLEHCRDIETYVSEKLHASKYGQLCDELCRKSAGIFLWVVLVTPILNQMYDEAKSPEEMTKYLKSVPENLEGVFVEILKRDPDGHQECIVLLQWVLYSTRPLSSIELYLAVQHSWDNPIHLASTLPEDDALNRHLVHNSHGLVELTRSDPPVAQFIHETVREFLAGKNGLCQLDAALQDDLHGQSHAKLAQACLCYFSQNIHILPSDFNFSNVDYEDIPDSELLGRLPFMEYAISGIFLHAESAEQNGIAQEGLLNLLTVNGKYISLQWRHLRNLLERHKVRRYAGDVSILYVMVDMKLSALAGVVAKNHELVNAKCGRYGSALNCACRGGSAGIVRHLLQEGADINVRGGGLKTPLHAAIVAKSPEVLQILLDFHHWDHEILSEALYVCINSGWTEGVKVLGETGRLRSVSRLTMSLAVRRGLVEVVRYFLDRGADVDGCSDILLHIPCQEGLTSVAHLPQKVKADVNRSIRGDGTALELATQHGKAQMVELLLHYGARVDEEGLFDESLLSVAIRQNNLAVVDVFLRNGVDANKTYYEGDIPLHFAIREGDAQIINVLLRYGADVNKANYHGQTALHIAVMNENVETPSMILQNGAHVNQEDYYGHTPLHLVARQKCIRTNDAEIVKTLLQNGAEIDAPSGYGKKGDAYADFLAENHSYNKSEIRGNTPLHVAVKAQCNAIIALLLSHGADINKTNDRMETACHLAAKGSTDVFDLLIQSGADINGLGSQGNTVLHTAVRKGSGFMVSFLLMSGFDITKTNDSGDTPLHLAAERGSVDNVNRLLNYGADIEQENIFGYTPLQIATHFDRNLVVELLVQRGARLDAKSIHKKSELH